MTKSCFDSGRLSTLPEIEMGLINLNVYLPSSINFENDHSIKGYCIQTIDNTYGIYVSDRRHKHNFKNINHDTCSNHSCFYEENIIQIEIVSHRFHKTSDIPSKNHLTIQNQTNKLLLSNLRIDHVLYDCATDVKNCAIIFYNYEEFLKSENLFLRERLECTKESIPNLSQFHLLKNFLSNDVYKCQNDKNTEDGQFFKMLLLVISYISTFSILFFNILHMLKFVYWGTSSIRTKRKMTVTVGNLILALLLDFVCGLIILNWNNQWYPPLVNKLFEIIDIIIPNLRKLLKWLMGSPAGLKLNHAFNQLLGCFFLYHVELWWIFLEIFRDVLEVVIEIIQYLGMLGITFQAAVLADLLSLASVHFHCIYIYATRLYNIQLRVLISLLRLFLGRKMNPLRDIVDSCHYNHQQLFIGTLGFTIFLFLLPTTVMYYFVFTLFRLMQLILSGLLVWTQFIVRSLPLYSLWLWIIRSPKITSDIEVTLMPDFDIESKPVVLSIKLKAPTLVNLIKTYKPDPIPVPAKIKWGELLSSLWRGKRI